MENFYEFFHPDTGQTKACLGSAKFAHHLDPDTIPETASKCARGYYRRGGLDLRQPKTKMHVEHIWETRTTVLHLANMTVSCLEG